MTSGSGPKNYTTSVDAHKTARPSAWGCCLGTTPGRSASTTTFTVSRTA